jgi:hypothetical protein
LLISQNLPSLVPAKTEILKKATVVNIDQQADFYGDKIDRSAAGLQGFAPARSNKVPITCPARIHCRPVRRLAQSNARVVRIASPG